MILAAREGRILAILSGRHLGRIAVCCRCTAHDGFTKRTAGWSGVKGKDRVQVVGLRGRTIVGLRVKGVMLSRLPGNPLRGIRSTPIMYHAARRVECTRLD